MQWAIVMEIGSTKGRDVLQRQQESRTPCRTTRANRQWFGGESLTDGTRDEVVSCVVDFVPEGPEAAPDGCLRLCTHALGLETSHVKTKAFTCAHTRWVDWCDLGFNGRHGWVRHGSSQGDQERHEDQFVHIPESDQNLEMDGGWDCGCLERARCA